MRRWIFCLGLLLLTACEHSNDLTRPDQPLLSVNYGAATLADLLRYLPGVTLTNQGVGGPSFVSLRGGEPNSTLVMINDNLYQSMPSDLQEIVDTAAKNAAAWNRAELEKMETALLEELKGKGMEVNDVDQKPFREMMTPAWDKLLEKAPEAKVYLEQILKAD